MSYFRVVLSSQHSPQVPMFCLSTSLKKRGVTKSLHQHLDQLKHHCEAIRLDLLSMSPTWFGRLGVRRGGGRGGGVLVDASLGQGQSSARRELHAQLLRHLHVIAGVDVVERTAAGQLHLQAQRKQCTG